MSVKERERKITGKIERRVGEGGGREKKNRREKKRRAKERTR